MNASVKTADVHGTATFADMIEQMPEALLLIDSSGLIAFANPGAAELFKTSPADVLGRPVRALIPEFADTEPCAESSECLRETDARSPTPHDRLLTGRRHDGVEFPLDLRAVPIHSKGREWTLASVRDTTQQQRALERLWNAQRAAEQAARSKGEFLAFAAHDLSQPMQSIALALSVAERCLPRTSEATGLLALAASSLRRVRDLLGLLLEISRLESPTMHAASECEHVREIFADLEQEFGTLARAKGLDFRAEPGGHIIRTDPTLVRALLANLVSNAVRYTSHGEIVLRCTGSAHTSLKLSVHDTGIGIAQADLQSIFDEFKRLDVARQAHEDGFGLGLAIVRRLSGLLGASLTVESSVGAGSTFTVEFPAGGASCT